MAAVIDCERRKTHGGARGAGGAADLSRQSVRRRLVDMLATYHPRRLRMDALFVQLAESWFTSRTASRRKSPSFPLPLSAPLALHPALLLLYTGSHVMTLLFDMTYRASHLRRFSFTEIVISTTHVAQLDVTYCLRAVVKRPTICIGSAPTSASL